jgi:hypothetical protein
MRLICQQLSAQRRQISAHFCISGSFMASQDSAQALQTAAHAAQIAPCIVELRVMKSARVWQI